MMPDPSDNILSYGNKPRALAALANGLARNRRFWIKVGVVGFLLIMAFGYLHGPTSGQIRLDTGDLRYCWWGIPLKYEAMPEPQRSKLLALAAQSPKVPAKWVTCVTCPALSSYHTELMYRDFYWAIAIWADEDPKIAHWAFHDVVDYLPGMLSRGGLPESCRLILDWPVVDWHTCRVIPGWRDNDVVKDFCADHGYVPAAAPASGPAK